MAKLTPEKLDIVSEWKSPIQKTCWTMPVLCKGFIYCRNLSGELVAVDVR